MDKAGFVELWLPGWSWPLAHLTVLTATVLAVLLLPVLLYVFWILAAASVCVTVLPIPVPQAFKDCVRLSAARGKLWTDRPTALGVLNNMSVPQSWFLHFYAIGTMCCLLMLIVSAAVQAVSPDFMGAGQVLAMWLFTAHLVRRLLETRYMMVYPEAARMHLIAYVFGCTYYMVAPISLVPHTFWDLSATGPLPKLIQSVTVSLTSQPSLVTSNLTRSLLSAQHAPTMAAAQVSVDALITASQAVQDVSGMVQHAAGVAGVAASVVLGEGEVAGAVAAVRGLAGGVAGVVGTAQGVASSVHELLVGAGSLASDSTGSTHQTWDAATASEACWRVGALGAQSGPSQLVQALSSVVQQGQWLILLGAVVMVVGFCLQCHSHLLLSQLPRKQAKGKQHQGYSIPQGGLFTWVTCPHYLGEIVIYAGLAALSWPLTKPLLMLTWVVVNLVLAASSTQRWYLNHFPAYPTSRRALIPCVF